MSAITLRGLDPAAMKALKQAARERHMSVNQFILETVLNHLGLGQTETRYHDLDEFFGTWDKAEHDRVRQSVRRQRKIDQELWQ